MKKIFLSLVMLFSIIIASTTFAADAKKNGYYVSNKTLSLKSSELPPTYIPIHNFSNNLINVTIPGQLDFYIRAGDTRNITHDSYYGNTRVVLQDPYRIAFWDQYVCRRAIITVYGRPGSYNITADPAFC